MGMYAFRLPDDMRKEMEKTNINWSEFIRQSIRSALESKQKQSLFLRIDRVMGKNSVKKGTSEKLIRDMRDNV